MSWNPQRDSDGPNTDAEEEAMSDQRGRRTIRSRAMRALRFGSRRHPALAMAVAVASVFCDGAPVSGAVPSPARRADCVVTALVADGSWVRGAVARIDAEGWHLLPIDAASPSSASRPRTIRPIALIADLDGWSAWNLSGGRDASDAQPAGMLVTQDGQLIPGALELDGSAARWNHRWIGKIPIDVDRIGSLRLTRGVRVAPRDDADVVTLVNGDQVVGFVESIGSEIEIDALASTPPSAPSGDGVGEPSDAGDRPREQSSERRPAVEDSIEDPTEGASPGTRSIDLARVASIAFVSQVATDAATPRAWTRDGSVVACRNVTLGNDGALSFLLADEMLASVHAGETASNLAADVAALVIEPDRIRPLAGLVSAHTAQPTDATRAPRIGAGVRVDPVDHLLGLEDLRLFGPQAIEIDVAGLGDGDAALTATLSILEPAPVDAVVGVELRADGVSVGSARVTADGPIAMTARIPIGTRALELILDDGGNGIAGDRLLIRRGAIVLGPRPGRG